MQQAAFLESRPKHPIGMGIVIAAHATVLAAIILSPPEFIRDRMPIMTVYPVEDTPPPPIEKPLPRPEQKAEKPERVTRPEVIVPTHTSGDGIELAQNDRVRPPVGDPLPPETVPTSDPVIVAAIPNMDAADMQPPYPPTLARAEVEGKAEIRILIGTDGRVKQVEEVSATDPGFFEATRRQALRHWRFKPATQDGVPIESWRTMTVRFQLQA